MATLQLKTIIAKGTAGMRELKFAVDKTLQDIEIYSIRLLQLPKCIDGQPFINNQALDSAYITILNAENVVIIDNYPLRMMELLTKGSLTMRGLELFGLIPNWENTEISFRNPQAVVDGESLQLIIEFKKIKR